MKDIIIYFIENSIELIYQNKKKAYILEQCVYQGRITDTTLFMQQFSNILKKEKIKSKLFGEQITVVSEVFYSKGDLFYIEHTFEEMGFIKVKFLDIMSLISTNETFIEINNTYMIIYLKKPIYFDLTIFKDIPTILKIFKKDYQESIILFGKNKNIPNIHIENLNIYYFNNFCDYISHKIITDNKKCAS